MNPNVQSRIADITAAIGAFVTFIISLTHPRIRPHLVNFASGVRILGIRSGRLVRQLLDRHVVAFALRPVLSISLVTVTVTLALGGYWLHKCGDFSIGEAGTWFAGIAIVVIALGVFVRVRAMGVRGLTDGGIDALETDSPVLQARRQLFQQALLQYQAVVDMLQTQFQQQLLAHQQACLAAVQANPTHPVYPPAPVMPTLPAEPVLPDLVLTMAQETAHETWLEAEVLRRFGRPGLAPSIAMMTLALWVATGLWFVGVGVILRQFYSSELEIAHVDVRVTSVFVGVGLCHLGVAMVLWIAGAVLSATSIRLGLGALVWGARLVLPPAIQVLPFWDVNNLNTILAPNLGIPSEEMAKSIREAHELPFAVLCAIGMLIITEHDFSYLGFLGCLAIVLLPGWIFIRWMKQSVSEKVVHGFVVGLFLLALVQLLRRMMGGSVIGDFASLHSALGMMADTNTYGMAMIVVVLVAFVIVAAFVLYFIEKNIDGGSLRQIAIGIIFLIMVPIAARVAYRIAENNQVHRVTVTDTADSSETADPARPPRSASSGTTAWYPPTVPPASRRDHSGT